MRSPAKFSTPPSVSLGASLSSRPFMPRPEPRTRGMSPAGPVAWPPGGVSLQSASSQVPSVTQLALQTGQSGLPVHVTPSGGRHRHRCEESSGAGVQYAASRCQAPAAAAWSPCPLGTAVDAVGPACAGRFNNTPQGSGPSLKAETTQLEASSAILLGSSTVSMSSMTTRAWSPICSRAQRVSALAS